MEELAKLSQADLIARLLKAEDNKRKGNTVSFKVGEKGGISAYGVGRFPATHYTETWVKLLVAMTGLKATDLVGSPLFDFITSNKAGLKFKNGIPELDIPADATVQE
jgi:hypothetical protein